MDQLYFFQAGCQTIAFERLYIRRQSAMMLQYLQ